MMHNIGFVVYTKTDKQGVLNASWSYYKENQIKSGSGIAIGEESPDFKGKYKVTYFDEKGTSLGTYDLLISLGKEVYSVKWILNGNTVYYGLGAEISGNLCVGWRANNEN